MFLSGWGRDTAGSRTMVYHIRQTYKRWQERGQHQAPALVLGWVIPGRCRPDPLGSAPSLQAFHTWLLIERARKTGKALGNLTLNISQAGAWWEEVEPWGEEKDQVPGRSKTWGENWADSRRRVNGACVWSQSYQILEANSFAQKELLPSYMLCVWETDL